MNDTTQKIAAQAAVSTVAEWLHEFKSDPKEANPKFVQSAIEKAYSTGLAQGYEKRAAKERELRAAHASEQGAEALELLCRAHQWFETRKFNGALQKDIEVFLSQRPTPATEGK